MSRLPTITRWCARDPRTSRGGRPVEVVAESGDGREALELVLRHRPDVALIDWECPA